MLRLSVGHKNGRRILSKLQPGVIKKGKPPQRNWIFFDSSVKNSIKLFHKNLFSQSKIDNTQKNSKCRLCGDRDEMLNHIINVWSKLRQKGFKTWHNRVGKVILWELQKRLKFEHADKWYTRKTKYVLENGRHKIRSDFVIEADQQIPTRRPDWVLIYRKKRNCNFVNSAVLSDHTVWRKEKAKMKQTLGSFCMAEKSGAIWR